MNVETIGLWAGAVWNALNDANGSLTVKGLKKTTKLKEKEVFAAIGWLAREGCLLYTSPSPRDAGASRMPSSA